MVDPAFLTAETAYWSYCWSSWKGLKPQKTSKVTATRWHACQLSQCGGVGLSGVERAYKVMHEVSRVVRLVPPGLMFKGFDQEWLKTLAKVPMRMMFLVLPWA